MGNVLVTVATYADPVEANLAKNNLEAAGIQAFLANEETVDMVWPIGNAIGWIKIQVGTDDADFARALLSQRDKSATLMVDEPAHDSLEAARSPRISAVDVEEEAEARR